MTRAPNTRKQHLHSYLNGTAELLPEASFLFEV
jgi:hypothetical protein